MVLPPTGVPGKYATEEAAEQAVDALKVDGRWPGIIRRRMGGYDLTWEPPTYSSAHDWRN